MKIRDKIALIFVAVTAITLLLLSIFIYLFSIYHTHRFFFTRLKVRASIALEAYSTSTQSHFDAVKELRDRHLQQLPDEKEYVVKYDSLTQKWDVSTAPVLPAPFYEEVLLNGYAEYDLNFIHYVGIYNRQYSQFIGVSSAYDEEGADQVQSLLNLLVVGFVLGCVLAYLLGRSLAYWVIKPVADIISEVNRINASNLDKRLTSAKGEDEIAALAQTFNSMLDRLHTAFQLQSNFISNASHELRTPLTSILGESEIILSGERDGEDYVRSIKMMRSEAEKLNDLVGSLLNLSQVGYDGKRQMLEEVSIDLLLMKIKKQIDKRFPGNHLNIVVKEVPENPDALVLMCIPAWIELAFLNIVNNAIKYSDNKEVLVTLSVAKEELIIRISDLGIGISQTDLQHVFELFFRGSNSQSYIGHGIGLPLADKIIRLHGGEIIMESEPGKGTTVTVRFSRKQIRKQ